MAKVNTLIHNEIYVSEQNPNMKFHIMVRSFDGTDRKSAVIRDDQFINGSIDGVDMMSDCLTDEDLWQSQHIILRSKAERTFNGHDYHMIESLANSCDIASCADFEQMVTDNKGHERRFRQYYTKEPDSKTVYVKSYVEDILVGESHFDFIYTPTSYGDEDPRQTCLTSYSANYAELQDEIITMIQEGKIVEKLPAPDIIEDTYTTHDVKFYYKGSWIVDIKPNGTDDYVNEVTFVLKYGTTKKTDVSFSTTPSLFSDDNYGTATTVLAEVAATEITKLKTYLDGIAAANDVQIPPDVTGFYRAGQTVYYYWLHYDSQTQDNDGDINTVVIYTLRWGIDDTANLFFSDKKNYNINNYAAATVELTELGNQQINELFNLLDNLTGVKLVTVDKNGNQEVGAHPRNIDGNALVLTAHEFKQGVDSKTQAMVHFDGDTLVDETGSAWTTGGGTPITTDQGASIGKGMLISDGRYISSKTIQMGAESFTVDFFAFVNESCPNEACICDINHPNCDIKIKLLKQFNSKTQETDTTIGFYVNNELKAQSKVDIIVLDTVCHYAVVYQQAKHALFFFVEGTMIGNLEQEIPKAATKVWFNYDVSANKSTFLGTIDEIRISTDLARWTTDIEFKEYDATQVVDEVGAVWQMHNGEVQPAPIGKGRFENPNNPGYTTGLYFNNQDDKSKYPKGIRNTSYKDDVIFAELLTDITLGGSDFTIDFWYYFEVVSTGMGGTFEINAINPNTGKITGSMGFHLIPSGCIHGDGDLTLGSSVTAKAKTLKHIAFVFTQNDGKLMIFDDGKRVRTANWPKMKTPHILHLNVGKYYEGGGPKGPMWGAIDEFRISAGIARWISDFTPATEPYEIDDYTKALLRTSSFGSATVTEESDEDFEVDNPNHIFNPPKVSYKVNAQITGDPTKLTNYYIPLAEHFDDDKFTIIDQLPVQKTPYPLYDGVTEYEPEWVYYDPQQLKIEGELRSKEAGTHYVTFTPWNDCLWQGNNGDKPKTVMWKIERESIKVWPEQEEPLYYKGEEQEANISNLNTNLMTLTGDLKATNANTAQKPFYIMTATLKEDYTWPSGMGGSYDINWQILPKPINRPTLKDTSSLDFTYDGTEKEPEFEYSTDYVQISGVTKATIPNSKHNDGSLLTEEYKITFSLKDKDNTCWVPDHSHDEEGDNANPNDGGNDDITFVWKIRRKPIPQFTVTNTTLTYNGEEQGPTITPSEWNTNEVTVTDHRKKPRGSYTAVFALADITKYEWEDGSTGNATIDWEITQAQGTLELSSTTIVLKAPPVPPTVDITITKTGTGTVTCSSDDHVEVVITNNILTITGKHSTEVGEPVTLTVTLADDNNYKGTSVDITVTVEMGLEAFSWEQIADMVAAGTLLSVTSIGDSKTVKLKAKLPVINTDNEILTEYDDSDDYAVKMILIGVDHNPDVEGRRKAHFMLGKMGSDKDIVFLNNKNIPVFDTATNAYGWRNSNLNLQLNTPSSGIYYSDIFPTDFLAVVTPCIKWTDNIGGGVNNDFYVTPTLDYVSIPSEYEVFGTRSYANNEEAEHQERYQYFANGGTTKRERTDGTVSNGWALRSVTWSSNSQVTAVNNSGNLVSVPINSILDITPVFTVSRKTEDSLTIPALNQCIETLMHFDDPSDPFKDECNTNFIIRDITSDAIKEAVVNSSDAKFGGALQFDGSTYATQQIPIILGGQDFTIDFWINYNSASCNTAGKQARGFVLAGPKAGIYCHRTANFQQRFTIGTWNGFQRTDFNPFNNWVHTAIVYHHDRQTVFFYFNGNLTTHDDSDTAAVLKYTFPKGKYTLVLGGEKSKGTAMIGAFDELRIKNGVALWTPPEWAFTRRATTADADRHVFDPPTYAGEASENDVLHNQVTGGYIIKLNNNVKTKVLTVTEHTGALHIKNTDPSVATVDFNSDTKTITITGKMQGTTTVTIYTDDTDTTYGTVKTLDIICDETIGLLRLKDCEPADIKNIIKAGSATKAWSVGDTTKEIQISGIINGQNINKTVKATLIGLNHSIHDETADNYNAYFMISGLDINLPMNDINTNEGGWSSTRMRQEFCEQVRNCFPVAWKNMISYCAKATDNKGTNVDKIDDDITVLQERIFLLSEYEIFGTTAKSCNLEQYKQQRYSHFSDIANIPTTWTRSCVKNNSDSFVISTGTAASTKTAGSENPVVFCFCVSDYAGPINLDEDQSEFTITKDITFDGADHNAVDEGIIVTKGGSKLDSKYFTWSGYYTGRDAKTYTISVKPAPGYRWSNDKEDIKTYDWKIKAADTEDIKVSKTAVRLYAKNPTETIDITRNNTSVLQVTVADSSLVSYTVKDNQLILTPIGLGTTTVTVVSPAAGNYGRGEAMISVTASNVEALNMCTPAKIQEIVLTGKANLAWDVGDSTADIRVKGTFYNFTIDTMLHAYILGFDHNSAVEGTKRLHMCLGRSTSDKEIEIGPVNKAFANNIPRLDTFIPYNSWLLTQKLDQLLSCIPLSWQNVISPCLKWFNEAETITKSFFIMGASEVIPSFYDSETVRQNTERYQYYSENNAVIRYDYKNPAITVSWATRTPSTNGFIVGINDSNTQVSTISIAARNDSLYFVPCFTISSTLSSPDLTVSKKTVSTTVGGTDQFTITRSGTGVISVTSSDTTIATVSLTGTTVTVTGVKTGDCNITVEVAATGSTIANAVTVPVTVGTVQKTAPVLTLSSSNLSITKGNIASCTVTVEGGTLSVKSNNETIATVKIDGNKITATGINEGTTTITVKVIGDSTHYDSEQDITVVVTSKPVVLDDIPATYNKDKISFKGDMTYNGTLQSVSDHLNGYSFTYHDLSGDIQKKDHNDQKDYTVIVTPKSGYQWQGGGTESKTVSWNIKQADAMISGIQTVTLVKDVTMTTDITYTVTGDGTLSAKSNNSLISVTTTGNKVTFSSACTSNDTATVTLTTSSTLNYKAATLDITVTVRMSALQVLPDDRNYSALSVKAAGTYESNTIYSINKNNVSDWISGFNSSYHTLSRVTDSNNATVTNETKSGVTSYKLQDAGTYKIWITPATGYSWDSSGNTGEKSLSWTINRKPLEVTTATQTGLSGTNTDMTYNGTAQTPTFDIQDQVDITVTSQTNAGTYDTNSTKAKVKPKANYCWKDGGTEEKLVTWKINPLKLTAAQEPKFTDGSLVYTMSNKTATVQKPTADNFTFDSSFPKSSFTFTVPTTGRSDVGTYNSGNYAAKFKINNSNYVFDDGTNTKIIPWKISPRKITKPSIASAYSKPYTGSKHTGITINYNITTTDTLVTNGYVTVTMNKYLGAVDNYDETYGFSKTVSTDHTVDFTPTNAGKYVVVYTLQKNSDTIHNVIWDTSGAEDVNPVEVTFMITRAEITTKPTLSESLPVSYTLNGRTYTINTQTATIESDKFSCTCNPQKDPGTYNGSNGILCTPTANYKWSKSVQSKPFTYYSASWKIVKAEGVITANKSSIVFSNEICTAFLEVTTATGTVSISKPDILKSAIWDDSKGGYNLTAFKVGSSNITLTSALNTYFNKATLTVPISVVVINRISEKKPTSFMKTFFAYLEWERIQGNVKTALDSAIKQTTNNNVESFDDIINAMKTIANTVKGKIGEYQNTTTFIEKTAPYLQDYFGIKVEGKWVQYTNGVFFEQDPDSGSIIGKDIGESTTNVSLSDVVKENSPSSIGSYPTTVQTFKGCNFSYPSKSSLTADQQWIIQAANTWWLKNSLELLEQAYGLSFESPHVDSGHINKGSFQDGDEIVQYDAFDYDRHNMIVNFLAEPDSGALASCGSLGNNPEYNRVPYTLSIDGTPLFLAIRYNTSYLASLDKTNKDGPASQVAGQHKNLFDTVTLHELTHGIMYATLPLIQGHISNYAWFVEGTAELMRGIDTERFPDMARLIVNGDLMQKAYDVTEEDYGTSSYKTYSYALGYMILRYVIKQYMAGKYDKKK